MKNAAVSWLASIGVGLSTAIVGAILAGWFADKAVSWYNVPIREGAQGYFVLFQGIFGAVGGLIIGFVVSRYAGGDASIARALAFGHLAVVFSISSIAGVARTLAHVPPEIGGERLFLAVEFSWPASKAPDFSSGDSVPHIYLYSTVSSAPFGKTGPLWTDKSRREGDRLIIPAIVEVYTSRGQRLLQLKSGSEGGQVIVVPLRGSPNKSDLEWSKWTPTTSAALPDEPMYRFHVIKRNEPVRSDTIGPFTVGMIAESFMFQDYDYRPATVAAKSSFQVRYNNALIPTRLNRAPGSAFVFNQSDENFKTISAVGAIAGNPQALVLHVDELYGAGKYCLLHVVNGTPTCDYMGVGSFRTFAHELHPAANHGDASAAKVLWALAGNFKRNAMTNTSLYVFPECVFDARTLKVREIPREKIENDLNTIAPVGLSPDAKKFARVVGDQGKPVLAVITIATGARQELSVQSAQSPTGDWKDVDRTWFDNYFKWEATANGEYEVKPSPLALALPRRGRLKQEPGYRQYDLSPVDSTMRDVVIDFMVKEMSGERVPGKPGDYAIDVKLKDAVLHVAYDENRIGVFADRSANTLPVATFAAKFDKVLATRRYDSLFLKEQPIQ